MGGSDWLVGEFMWASRAVSLNGSGETIIRGEKQRATMFMVSKGGTGTNKEKEENRIINE